MADARAVLKPSDRVSFDGGEHVVTGLVGTSVRLRSDSGTQQVVLAGHLMSAPDFAVLDATALPALEPFGLLEALPQDVVTAAERWRDHLVEVETGLPPDADLVEVSVDERRPLLREVVATSPASVGNRYVTTGLADAATPDAVAASASRIAVFRVDPV